MAPGTGTRPSQMVARGVVRHCARCGGGHLFSSWFHLRERCPTCGMRFEREEGFWLGGYVINFATGEGALLVLLAVLIGYEANGVHVHAWPFVVIGLLIAVGGPALTFPYSRTVWSALDLIMRPLTPEEVVQAQAAVATAAISTPPSQPPRPA